ncbi:MAG TPA: PAS domain-containing protein [Candidatus Binatia bacterium]|nr:PAS domain-containing protein [Candidatus Binatia bacterium]
MADLIKHLPERPLCNQAAVNTASESVGDCFRDLVQELKAILWEADPTTWQFLFVSKQAEAILGYPVEQWLSEPDFWVNHIYAADRERAVSYCQNSTAKGEDHEFDYRMVAADGRVVWLHDIVRVAKNEEGRPRQLYGLMVDITERKRSEEALRYSEQRFQIVARATNDAVWDWNLLTDEVWWNEGVRKLFGYLENEVGPGATWWYENIHSEDRESGLRHSAPYQPWSNLLVR